MERPSASGQARLLLIGDGNQGPLTGAGVIRLAQAWLRENREAWLIGPSFLSTPLGEELAKRFVAWPEVRNFADAFNEDLADFFRARDLAISQISAGTSPHFSAAVESLAYGIVAPLSEDLPFLVSGLFAFLRKKKIAKVFFSPASPPSLTALGVQVAAVAGIPVEEVRALALRLYDWRVHWFGRLKMAGRVAVNLGKLAGNVNGHAWSDGKSECDVFLIANKARSLRIIGPIAAEAQRAGLSIGLYSASVDGEKICPGWQMRRLAIPLKIRLQFFYSFWGFFLCASWRWLVVYRRLKDIPVAYRGIPILRFHRGHIGEVLLARGPMAAASLRVYEWWLRSSPPKLLVTVDPLEGSRLAIRVANQEALSTKLYYSAYNGYVSTASLWEKSLDPVGQVLAINDWVRERADRAGLSRDPAIAVGDVFRSAVSRENRDKIRIRLAERFGLDPGRKWVLFLSRVVSSALSAAEKHRLLQQSAEAARAQGAELIVKGHPYEKIETLKREVLAASANGSYVFIREVELSDLVTAVDLAISTPASASALDAFYAHVPVILSGPRALFDQLDTADGPLAYRRNHAGEIIYSENSIAPSVGRLLADETARRHLVTRGLQFAEKIVGDSDGRAAIRIAEVLRAFVARKR